MRSLITIALAIMLPLISVSQNPKKAFKKLEKGELNEAHVIFKQMIDNDEDNPIANYGLAVIYSNKNYINYDLFKARNKISIANRNFKNINADNLSKLDDYISKETFIESKSNIEKRLKDFVFDQNKIDITKKFVYECKDSPYFKEVEKLLHKQEYNRAMKFNNELALKEFIEKYPMSEQAGQAQEHIFSIAWGKANSKGTKEAYKDFMREYPTSSQYEIAADKIREIDYKRAMNIGTDDAFEFFINKYPNSKQANALIKEWESTLYRQAKEINAVKVYNKYLNKFPNSDNALEIKEIRDSLMFKKAADENTQSAYANFVQKYPNAKQIGKAMERLKDFSYSKAELIEIEKRNRIIKLGIKDVNVFKQYKGDTLKTIFKKKTFDENGKLVKLIKYPNKSTNIEYVYKYSPDGNLVLRKAKFENNKLLYDIKYEYNNKNLNHLQFKTIFNESEADTIQIKNTFDELNRNLTEKVFLTNSGEKKIKKIKYFYDRNNLPLQVKFGSDSVNLDIVKTNYQYDSYGNLIQKTNFTDTNTIKSIITNTYKNGQKIKSVHNDQIGKYTKLYYYDFQGRLIKVEVDFENKNNQDYFLIYEYL